MSSILVLASNRPLKKKPYPSELAIHTDIDSGTVDDGGADDGFAIFPREKVPEIQSDKPYFAAIEWQYTPGRAETLTAYLKEHLKGTAEIELWHVWLDMDFGHRVRKVEIPISELSPEDIQELDGLEVTKEPITDYCCVIKGDSKTKEVNAMRKTTLMVTRYQAGDGFYVDVIPDGKEASFWLGHRDCDVQERMFAASLELAPQERWEKLIEDNIDECKEDFAEAWLEE